MHRYAVPPVPFPNNDEQAGKAFALPADFESEAPRAVEATLSRGDVLYVPRGFVHAATCGEEPSLHATVAVATYDWTWAKLCASAAEECWLGRTPAKIASRLEKYTYWRRCAAPPLVCDGHRSKAWQRGVAALEKLACVVGVEPNAVVSAWKERLGPHRAAQDAPLAGRDGVCVTDRASTCDEDGRAKTATTSSGTTAADYKLEKSCKMCFRSCSRQLGKPRAASTTFGKPSTPFQG
jgi:hypothetical protein